MNIHKAGAVRRFPGAAARYPRRVAENRPRQGMTPLRASKNSPNQGDKPKALSVEVLPPTTGTPPTLNVEKSQQFIAITTETVRGILPKGVNLPPGFIATTGSTPPGLSMKAE